MATGGNADCSENKENKYEFEMRQKLEFGSDDIDLPLCDPCEIGGSQIPATGYCTTCGEYLCNQCYGYHCKPKPMRHHVLVDALQKHDVCSAIGKETPEPEQTPCTSIEVISKHSCSVYGGAMDDDDDTDTDDTDDEDEVDCNITGSTSLKDGRVAFVDYSHKSVKVYSPRENSLDASRSFSSSPFDAAEIAGRIAVTFPKRKKIHLLSLRGSKLKRNSLFTTKGSCYGISCDQNILYVAFDDPPKIEMLDMAGIVLKSFARNVRRQYMCSSPRYVAHNPVNCMLYVTDRDKNTVTCLSTQGEVLTVYKDGALEQPCGISADLSGTLFVCAHHSNSIYCLRPDLSLISVIKDKKCLRKPKSVACWNKRDRLFVGFHQDDVTVLDIDKR